jgi:hypothetical protein
MLHIKMTCTLKLQLAYSKAPVHSGILQSRAQSFSVPDKQTIFTGHERCNPDARASCFPSQLQLNAAVAELGYAEVARS